jgi:RimJ/RimL family protein N-acetyltransferase
MGVKENRLVLKILYPENVTQNYLGWMQDEDITQFMECRGKTYALVELKDYTRMVDESHNDFLFGIYTSSDNVHIGNIKIGEINQLHKFGNLGLMIGEKKYWDKGYGTEAVKLATEYAFHKLRLNKLLAGIYENNTGCYKAFLKAGYNEVGRLKKHRSHKDEYVDQIFMEKLNDR